MNLSLPVKKAPQPHSVKQLYSTILLIALPLLSCDLIQEAQTVIVTQHRASIPGRVGMLRGMETHTSATLLTESIKNQTHTACPKLPNTPLHIELTLKAHITTPKADNPNPAHLTETRHLYRDAHGSLQITWEASFLDPSGRQSTWKRQERLVNGWHYIAEENLPYVRRRARPQSAQQLQRRTLDAIPTVLWSAQDTWRHLPNTDRWISQNDPGGETLHCNLPTGDQAWLQRLLQIANLESAEATLSLDHQSISSTMTSTGPHGDIELHLQIQQKQHTDIPKTITAPTNVTSIQRDRPYRDIQRILGLQLGLSEWRP